MTLARFVPSWPVKRVDLDNRQSAAALPTEPYSNGSHHADLGAPYAGV